MKEVIMEFSVFNKPVDGFLNLKLNIYERSEGRGKSIDMSIWVKENDSRKKLEIEAKKTALEFLKNATKSLEDDLNKSME